MTTRITIRSPDDVAETYRALAEANRQRLDERQRENWQWRDTLREIERRKAQVDDELARNSRTDPWRGAVPEVEPAEFVPVQLRGKRFKVGAAWFRVTGGTQSSTLTVSTQRIGQSAAAEVSVSLGFFPAFFALPAGGERVMLFFGPADLPEQAPQQAKVFIVTRSTIRQVGAPSGLLELLARGGTLPNQYGGNEWSPWFEPNVFGFLPDFYFMLIQSYGFGQLVDRAPYTIGDLNKGRPTELGSPFDPEAVTRANNAQNRNWGWTPSFLAYLKNYDGRFHNSDSSDLQSSILNYKYVRDTFFPLDAPAYMLTSGYLKPPGEVDTTFDCFYFRSPASESAAVTDPSAFSTLTGELRLRPNLARLQSAELPAETLALLDDFGYRDANRYTTNTTLAGTPVFTWDWGRPIACINALLDLGFSAGDLDLSPLEAAAIAAGGSDRFLF